MWGEEHLFNTTYKNVINTTVTSPYNQSTNKIDVSMMENGSNIYDHQLTSSFGIEELGTPPIFSANQFHWHSGSEHTIDNVRYDFEMHTVHYPNATEYQRGESNGYIAAALGVVFDVNRWDKVNVTE